MADNKSADLFKGKWFWRITPPKEKLWEKIISLEEVIARYEAGQLADAQKQILGTCENYLKIAKDLLKAKGPTHPHLIWNLLHRVDEHVILIMSKNELAARVIDVKTAFDLTIKEEPARKAWLGEKGKLEEAINDIDGAGTNLERSRFMVKEALQYLDDLVDYGFWKLSMNNLMSVSSAVLLAGVMLIYYFVPSLRNGITTTSMEPMCFALLGLMGGYLSNLLTKEDFLFVWGGPFIRYLLYNLMVRPIIGAFSAVFIFLVEKSKLVFSINAIDENTKTAFQAAIININVNKGAVVYVYMVLAVAVGFAGEKILRQMMDTVLKRLEEKAEKTKETGKIVEKDKKDPR